MKTNMLLYIVGLPLMLAAMLASAGAEVVNTKEGAEVEIAETMPEHLRYFYEIDEDEDGKIKARGVFAENRKWEAGDTLKVCFFGGSPYVRKIIKIVASQWSMSGNIKFDFGDNEKGRNCRDSGGGFSQIRIGFAEKGYWSAVGTDSNIYLNANQPSMNLQGFDIYYANGSVDEVTNENLLRLIRVNDHGTILHEFGHAIGMLHEAQNPLFDCQSEIRFEGPDGAYAYYGAPPNNWSREVTYRNLGPAFLVDPDAKATKPDLSSVNMYSLPSSILINGLDSKCYTKRNNFLSDGDKKLVAHMYPSGTGNPAELPITSNDRTPVAAPPSTMQMDAHLERVLVDLQSPAPTARREARKHLAVAVQGMDANRLVEFLGSLKDVKRDAQLDMLSAIDSAKSIPELTEAQRRQVLKKVEDLQVPRSDEALRNAVQGAKSKLGS